MDNSNICNQWWTAIKDAFTGINLKSLTVVCPKCREKGLVTTRWIKGPSLKPIYILHIKREKVRKVCELDQKQSNMIRDKVSILEGDIKRILNTRRSFILFSGGKDSLATLVYLKEIAKKEDTDLTAIYVDTTVGLPENTKYVKKVCKYLEVNLKIVRPKVDYFTLVKEWGIPSFNYRWCCRELKIKPIEEYLNGINEPKVVFDGIRAAESSVRKQYIPIWFHPSFKCLSVSPIFYWSDHQVISFINNNGIPKTLLHSLLGSSTECWCGAYKTETDFRKLYDLNRDLYNKLVEVEEENKNRFTFIYKSGHKIPLRDLEKQILKEKNSSR
jgi:3'-phosphoadenosine 5'-phosphosulfate sulfotransferase (PAPS reductase)/FAD synthetase